MSDTNTVKNDNKIQYHCTNGTNVNQVRLE